MAKHWHHSPQIETGKKGLILSLPFIIICKILGRENCLYSKTEIDPHSREQ